MAEKEDRKSKRSQNTRNVKFSMTGIENVCITLSTALKFLPKFFWKRSFFIPNQQPLNNVEPCERIFRALFIAQCPYKFSYFLDLRNGSSRFRLFARDFRLFRFFFPGSACFPKVPPPENLQSWVKYYKKSESFGKEFRWTKFMRWRGWKLHTQCNLKNYPWHWYT